MARHEHLPIYKAVLDLTVHFEKPVAGFSRYHKYTLGTELREGSRAVLMQVGAFVEQLQWPPRRIAKLRATGRSKATGRAAPHASDPAGAVQGFPLAQLNRRVPGLVATGQAVTFVAQRGDSCGGLIRRAPVARWASGNAKTGVNERPV